MADLSMTNTTIVDLTSPLASNDMRFSNIAMNNADPLDDDSRTELPAESSSQDNLVECEQNRRADMDVQDDEDSDEDGEGETDDELCAPSLQTGPQSDMRTWRSYSEEEVCQSSD